MKMKLQITILATIYFIVSFIGIASASWNFNSMIRDVESKIPIAQKQAEIIINALNNDNHVSRLQDDVNQLKSNMRTCQPINAKDTYLYRVMNHLDASFENSAISEKIMGGTGHNNYAQILSPAFLLVLCTGEPSNKRLNHYIIDKQNTFLGDRTKAQRLVALCERLQFIQESIQLVAREKIDMSNEDRLSCLHNNAVFSHKYGPNIGKETHNAYAIYNVIIPNRMNTSMHQLNQKLSVFESADQIYLQYLVKLFEFMDSMGYPVQGGSWNQAVNEVNNIIVQRAEKDDFDDLFGPPQPDNDANRDKSSPSLDIDDLLP